MTGQLHKNRGLGSTNESFCEAMMGRFASMVYVPNDQDFGIDFYCLPRVPSGKLAESPAGICGIQVKPQSTKVISFGGRAKNGTWAEYQLIWLRTLRLPLYVAVVDAAFTYIELFSLSRCVQIFWKSLSFPYRIDCRIGRSDAEEHVQTSEPWCELQTDGIAGGDDQVWNVDLGPPFLRLRFADMENDAVRESRRDVLSRWMEADRWSQENVAASVPVVRIPQKYKTNELPHFDQKIMFWKTPGVGNAVAVAEHASTSVVFIARQLLTANQLTDAKAWLPALEWLHSEGVLDNLGADLLSDLRAL